jgi:hypothetical protein
MDQACQGSVEEVSTSAPRQSQLSIRSSPASFDMVDSKLKAIDDIPIHPGECEYLSLWTLISRACVYM